MINVAPIDEKNSNIYIKVIWTYTKKYQKTLINKKINCMIFTQWKRERSRRTVEELIEMDHMFNNTFETYF